MAAGAAAAAVVIARNRQNNRIPRTRVSPERLEHIDKELKEMKLLTNVFKKYDTNKSGKLERDNVRQLLTDFDNSTPPGTPPSEEELTFIIKLCDDQCHNGVIDRSEVKEAIVNWRIYVKQRESMTKAMEEHDKSQTGKLDKDELKAYLTTVNHGQEVEDAEVELVLAQADVLGDGQIGKPELLMATSVWYSHVQEQEENKSSFCTVL